MNLSQQMTPSSILSSENNRFSSNLRGGEGLGRVVLSIFPKIFLCFNKLVFDMPLGYLAALHSRLYGTKNTKLVHPPHHHSASSGVRPNLTWNYVSVISTGRQGSPDREAGTRENPASAVPGYSESPN